MPVLSPSGKDYQDCVVLLKKFVKRMDILFMALYLGKLVQRAFICLLEYMVMNRQALWALLEWAESQIEFLRKRSFFIFPCLNPWGFNENSRCDRQNIDLNRRWLTSKTITTKAVSEKMENYRVLLGVNLHEDYDANGIYLYEASARKKADYLANEILNAGKEFMPIDTRKKIEGRWARNGVIRPDANSLPKEGIPEAVFLQKKGAERIFVFETPSEYDLRLRVKTQVKMLERAVSEML